MDASCYVHTIRLLVIEANPALEIAQDFERIVTELILAIVVCADAAELDEIVVCENLCACVCIIEQFSRGLLSLTYRRYEAGDMCSNFGMHGISCAICQLHAGWSIG